MNSETALLQEFLQMMARCRQEISDLRADCDRLRPRAEAYDRIGRILGMMPPPPQGAREDLVWRLDQRMHSVEVMINQAKDGTLVAVDAEGGTAGGETA